MQLPCLWYSLEESAFSQDAAVSLVEGLSPADHKAEVGGGEPCGAGSTGLALLIPNGAAFPGSLQGRNPGGAGRGLKTPRARGL